VLVLAFSLPTAAQLAHAQTQQNPIIEKGDAVVTGFSGSVQWPNPKGTKKVDFEVINNQGMSLQVFNLTQMFGSDTARLVKAPQNFAVSAGKIGQVFGVALDDGVDAKGNKKTPNIYATATSAFGLQILKVTQNQIDRTKSGGPNAQWMQGQFGARLGGGPGSIWKINGESGAISLFANVKLNGQENTGPALGNIAFDPRSRKLFVSDLQTGMIHGFGLDGGDTGWYDHGQQGRAADGQNPMPFDDASRVSISNPKFDSENPETWGMAPVERRVWGLAVRGQRLFYAVAEGPQIWSIGLKSDGGFSNDARFEIEIKTVPGSEISSITFGDDGSMYLSQRGPKASSYDYSVFAKPNAAAVLRYGRQKQADGSYKWLPEAEEYAIGFANKNRNTNGGVALGYGYYPDGSINYESCRDTLWSSGGRLRHNKQLADRLGTPALVDGLQGMQRAMSTSKNSPPFRSYHIDYDDTFKDEKSRGHVGALTIWSTCGDADGDGKADTTASAGPRGWKPRVPGEPAIRIAKTCSPAALGGQLLCTVTLRNNGDATPSDRVGFDDVAETVFGPSGGNNALTLVSVQDDDPRWECSSLPATALECSLPGSALTPGSQYSVNVIVDIAQLTGRSGWRIKNAATLSTDGTTVTAWAGGDLELTKTGPSTCRAGDVCTFQITLNNNGSTIFTGDLAFADDLTIAGAQTSGVQVVGVYPSQGCSQPSGGGLPAQWQCQITVPANDFKTIYVDMQIPKSAGPASGSDPARNCALVSTPGLALAGGSLQGGALSTALGAAGGSGGTPGIACHDFNVSAANSVTPNSSVNPTSLPQWPNPSGPLCFGQPDFQVTSVTPSTFSTAGVPVSFEYTLTNTTNCEIKAFRIDESLPMFQPAICGAPAQKVTPPGGPAWGDWWGALKPNEQAFCSSLYITPNVQFDIINDVRVDSKW
jgi:hypothetical protein